MNAAVLFSGGKDSTMALYYALNKKEDVKFLLSMKSRNDESYMFHVPNNQRTLCENKTNCCKNTLQHFSYTFSERT